MQIAWFYLLVIPIGLHSMYNAQANLLMLGAILFGLAGAVDKKWNRAAGWMAVATLIKGYPLALAMLMVVLYGRRFAVRFIAAIGIGLLLPFLAHWPRVVSAQYASWFGHMRDSTELMRERVRTIDHLFVIYGEPLSSRAFLLSQVVAGLVVLGLAGLYFFRNQNAGRRAVTLFSLFACWTVLFGPATEACAYAIVAPAIAWSVVEVFENKGSWMRKGTLIFGLILMGPATNDTFGQTLRTFANAHGCQPVGALLFIGSVLARLVGRERLEPVGQLQDVSDLAVAA